VTGESIHFASDPFSSDEIEGGKNPDGCNVVPESCGGLQFCKCGWNFIGFNIIPLIVVPATRWTKL
jgi:hypothetical protein